MYSGKKGRELTREREWKHNKLESGNRRESKRASGGLIDWE